MPKTRSRRSFGSVRRLQSGRLQARYVCPTCLRMHPAHITFVTDQDATTWLAGVRTDIARNVYVCPDERKRLEDEQRVARQTFRQYAEPWLATRRKPNGAELTERTKRLYRRQLDELLVTFGDLPLPTITDVLVRQWWTRELPLAHPGRLTGNAHQYALLRTILGSALEDKLITSNPANIKAAGSTKRQKSIEPATAAQLDAIADAAPEEYRMAVLLAGWCALRFGEVFELRRKDIGADGSTIAVTRAVTHRDGNTWVGAPKANSVRTVSVPPHLQADLLAHITDHAAPGTGGLLFPGPRGKHLLNSTCYRWYGPARAAAGRPDLRFHDLRHTGLTLFAHAGAGLADLMNRAGHRSVSAAQVYMHAAQGRDAELAERMSEALQAG